MRLNAAASTAIESAVMSRPRPVELLGVAEKALYLRSPGDGAASGIVVAVLTSDAVRLPCALMLGSSSVARPLLMIRPTGRDVIMFGNGGIQWVSRGGAVAIHVVRWWTPPTVLAGELELGRLAALRGAVDGIDIGIDAALCRQLVEAIGDPIAEVRAVAGLLGRGPGLTPSGDDVLAGFLLGARAFGAALDGVGAAVRSLADDRTTALSSQLLRHAVDGHAITEVSGLLAALCGSRPVAPAIAWLLRVGHTSGAALARGMLLAGQLALAQ